MKKENLINYQAVLKQYQKQGHDPDNSILNPDKHTIPPMIDGYVDYQAAIKAWDKEQAGMYKIHLHVKKRNPSHDPEQT